jgi:hypothetical protein
MALVANEARIATVAMPVANTPNYYTFPSDTKRFTIQAVEGRDGPAPVLRPLRIALNEYALLHGTFWTNVGGMNYYETDIRTPIDQAPQFTIHFESPFNNITVEIFCWRA